MYINRAKPESLYYSSGIENESVVGLFENLDFGSVSHDNSRFCSVYQRVNVSSETVSDRVTTASVEPRTAAAVDFFV